MLKKLIVIIIIIPIFVAIGFFVAKSVQKSSKSKLLSGGGEKIKITEEEIYLWENYKNGKLSGVIGKARHGEKIEFINKAGNAVLVKTAKGQAGWVYTSNIKEVKNSGIFIISTKNQ